MPNYGPNRDPDLKITMSYECRGRRVTKEFTCAYAARRFYAAKFKAGKEPKIEQAAAQ